jgi:hypothetical protein
MHLTAKQRQWLRAGAIALLFGAAVTISIAWLAAGFSTPWTDPSASTQEARDNDRRWIVTSATSFAAEYLYSLHTFGRTAWCPQQALGPPNATPGTDHTLAWASASTDAQREWLELEFDQAYSVKAVEIHETYCPGAIDKITAYDRQAHESVAWQGTDPTPTTAPAGVSTIPISIDFPTRRIRIHLNSPAVSGWNEIDAVALVDDKGAKHWAIRAKASSFFGDQRTTGTASGVMTFDELASVLAPFGWLKQSAADMQSGNATDDERIVLAYGWPFTAMWREDVPAGISSSPVTISPRSRSGIIISSGIFLSPGGSVPTPAKIGQIPYRPLIWGFLADSVLFAVTGAILYWLLVRPRRFFREVGRLKRGCCIACGYQLGYDFKSGCPNCGWRRGNDFPPVS